MLDALHLTHTASSANFVFFDTERSQSEFAEALRRRGLKIGRAFSPYAHWAPDTLWRIGLLRSTFASSCRPLLVSFVATQYELRCLGSRSRYCLFGNLLRSYQ